METYYCTVSAASSVSLEEVRILGEWQLPPQELAAVLFVARRAGVSPDVIATQRGSGAPWSSIVRRYGVSAGVFRSSSATRRGSRGQPLHSMTRPSWLW